MSYYKESKKCFIETHTLFLANEIYLDKKYHSSHKNSIEQIYNTSFCQWVLNEKEKENIIKNAIKIFKEKSKK